MLGLAVLGGALIAGACYYFNKLTEEEREYQREIRREHRRYREGIEKSAEEYKNKAKEELLKKYKGADIEQEEILKRAKEIIIKEVVEYYKFLKEAIVKRIEGKSNDLEEVKKHLEDLKEIKTNNTTYVRNRSYNIIEIELFEAKNYLEGYLKYLEEYDMRLEKEYKKILK